VRYYTRSRKVDGWVIREYVGSGPIAEMAAQRDEAEREWRVEEARTWSEERERLGGPRRTGAGTLDDLADLLVRAALLAAGYRQHERGEWRRPRERNKSAS
jgi:hypothetical protein